MNNFASTQLQAFQNPKMGKILELFGAFSKTWEHELRLASDGQISDAINSIVAKRHIIAHGGTSHISMSSVRNYYADEIRGAAEMCRICGV